MKTASLRKKWKSLSFLVYQGGEAEPRLVKYWGRVSQGLRVFFLLILVGSWVSPGWSQSGSSPTSGAERMFEKMCYSCHNIGGGDKKGPDLMNLLQRRDRAWLHRFIPSPQSLRSAGDPTAVKLFNKYAPEEMPDQTLTPEQIDQILNLIESLSKKKKTFIPKSGRLSRRPRPQDIPAGRQLFTGQIRLSKGAPPCITCHTVSGVGYLGGGTLGPDLTNTTVKYAEVELVSILKNPAFPTMAKVFTNHSLSDEEVVKLFAYLQSLRSRTPEVSRYAHRYLIGGVVGMLLLLTLMSFWKNRGHREG